MDGEVPGINNPKVKPALHTVWESSPAAALVGLAPFLGPLGEPEVLAAIVVGAAPLLAAFKGFIQDMRGARRQKMIQNLAMYLRETEGAVRDHNSTE